MALETILDPVLGWTLNLPLWLALAILSFLIALVITVVYRFATDQKEMKRLKEKTKKYQKQMRENRDNPKKLAKIQKEAMQVNMSYMGKSIKPTLYTIIPLLFVFMWMNAAFALDPIVPEEEFSVTAYMQTPDRVTLETTLDVRGEVERETIERQATWRLSGPAGEHELEFISMDGDRASHTVVIDERPRDQVVSHQAPFTRTEVDYQKATPFGDFSIFGYNPGWLFTYILFSIFFSIGLRKLMKIY